MTVPARTPEETTVNTVVLPYLKAYAALAGALATALLGIYAADTEIGKVLTVVAVVATVVTTWAVPNLDPAGRHQADSVQPPDVRHRDERGAISRDTAVILGLVLLLLAVVLILTGALDIRVG